MTIRIVTLALAAALALLAAYFLAFQQHASHQVDLHADELTAPASDAMAFAEFRWYANQLENLAVEAYARGVEVGVIRSAMHDALDEMWSWARVTSDTTRCDLIQCNPRLCAPWCPDMPAPTE